MADMTGQLMNALMAHYRKPGTAQDGEVLLPEVAAPGSNRRCDLLRIGVWPSRGMGIDVHELKVSRSDWLRELDDPGKADAWWPYSSRFWVVAPPKMIRPEEMPPGWGLMEAPSGANRRRFKVVVKPEDREPKLTVALLADLVGRCDNIRAGEIWTLKQDHRNELATQERKIRAEVGPTKLDRHTQDALDVLAKFEAAMGATLREWVSHVDTGHVSVDELVTALGEYCREHVALQRRCRDAEGIEDRIRRAANYALTNLPGGDRG